MSKEARHVWGKAAEVQAESSQLTKQMLRDLQHAVDVGGATALELNSQGEQLNNVTKHLDSIDSSLNQADQQLGFLESWLPFLRTSSFPSQPASTPSSLQKVTSFASDAPLQSGTGPERTETGRTVLQNAPAVNQVYQDEIDRDLGDISAIVGRLKGMATGMGSELDSQNQQLGRMAQRSDQTSAHLAHSNKRIHQLLK